VDGVELSAEAAAEAGRYREMHVGSIENPALRERIGTGYAAVLLLDVLEHLVDPETILREAHGWLAPGGAVLCSIPNVAHWRVRLGLLRGHFEYEDSGLLDRTHLRWYTRRTARALVGDAGYEITWEDAVVPQHPRVRVPGRILRPELFGYQFLIEGRAPAST
jgi:2-polyprenyl-3-methyl-5-hydroxy-6-metoxy-1,4-benzoquinol methylase